MLSHIMRLTWAKIIRIKMRELALVMSLWVWAVYIVYIKII